MKTCPRLTICYFTCRREPHFDWFLSSLYAQTNPSERAAIQLVVVDGKLWGEIPEERLAAAEIPLNGQPLHDANRRQKFATAVAGRFPLLHVPPLPCAWNGPWRQTKRDWFAAANARNTGLMVAVQPYFVAIDDLSVLGRAWYLRVSAAARRGVAVAGAYQKVLNLQVSPAGRVLRWEEHAAGHDSRWGKGSADSAPVPWSGGDVYGCSFGLPLEAALRVDGFEERCNGQGAEDYDFGIRVQRSGCRWWYDRQMFTFESEEGHWGERSLPREKRFVAPQRLPVSLASAYPNGLDSDHVLIKGLIHEPGRILPVGRPNLTHLRQRWLECGLVATPSPNQVDWCSGTPLPQL